MRGGDSSNTYQPGRGNFKSDADSLANQKAGRSWLRKQSKRRSHTKRAVRSLLDRRFRHIIRVIN